MSEVKGYDEQTVNLAVTLLHPNVREMLTPLEAHRIKVELLNTLGVTPEFTPEQAKELLSVPAQFNTEPDGQPKLVVAGHDKKGNN